MEILNLGIDYGSEHPIYTYDFEFDDDDLLVLNIHGKWDDDFEAFLLQNRENIYDIDVYAVKENKSNTVEFAKPLRIKDIHFEEKILHLLRGGWSMTSKWLVLKLGFQNVDADDNFEDMLRLQRFVKKQKEAE